MAIDHKKWCMKHKQERQEKAKQPIRCRVCKVMRFNSRHKHIEFCKNEVVIQKNADDIIKRPICDKN